MIRVYQRPKIIHLFLCALFGVTVMSFGGTALAATAPTVTKLEFKDTKGTADPSDDAKIVPAVEYEAYGVSTNGKGNAYVTDPAVNILSIFNTNGRLAGKFSINKALAVAVNDRDLIYVGGSLNGTPSIFVIDNNGDGKDESGNLGTDWVRPTAIAVGASQAVYVVDSGRGVVRKVDVQTGVSSYGPFGGEKYASEVIGGVTYYRTRHVIQLQNGIAVDEGSGLAYVSAKEFVDYLSNNGGATNCSGSGDICAQDTGDAWRHYNDVLGIATDSTYKYWWPVSSASAVSYQVLVFDMATGVVKKRIVIGDGSDYSLRPRGLALDWKGRLYVATVGGLSGGDIRVFDAATGVVLSVNGGFAMQSYNALAFHPDPVPDPDPTKAKGRLFAVGGSREVSVFSIDGGMNPANSAPSTPALLSPANRSYASSATPILSVANSSDPENDPLTYGYEIKDKIGNIAASASGIKEGSGGNTDMAVNTPLAENAVYTWRAQAFDGNAAAWSGEAEFCYNTRNDNPTTPAIIAPNGEKVSPFSSSLSWNPSSDPDCYDTVSYSVELFNGQGFSATLTSGNSSVRLANVSGLKNGGIYQWRVKAVDNNGGESAYSEGSFIYKTTVVRFESGQSGAKVYIDGNYGYFGRLLGQAPVEVQDLTPGSHFVSFVKAGYEPYHTIVNVADPMVMVNDSVITVSAGSDRWVKASRIEPEGNQWVEIARVGGYASPFVVDYNNDGLKDMIVGGGDGKLYLYLSEEMVQADGTKKAVLTANAAVQAGGADISVGTRAVPFVVDYNNDGRKDLLIGSGDGLISLYLNTGYENAPALTSAGTIKDSVGYDIKVFNSAPVVVDYNNDGKKDLVVGGFDGKLRLYKNIGTDASPEFDPIYGTITALDANLSIADINVGSNSKPFFTDWNSDGKKDLVVGREIADSEGSTVNLFLNVGTDDSPSFATAPGLKKWIMEKKKVRGNREFIPYLGYNHDLGNLGGDASPFVVDWNGSSARDVVVGNGGGSVIEYTTIE